LNKLKTVVWDVDDVLNNLMYEWLNFWLLNHPHFNISYSDLFENPPNKILNISYPEYINSLDEFRKNFGYKLKYMPEVLSWFQNYGNSCRHVVLTSTPSFFSANSAYWVISNFGKWIRSFNFIPSPRKDDQMFTYDKEKVDFLIWFEKADLFIDDNDLNIEMAKEKGFKTLLMPRPWNKSNLSLGEALTEINKILKL
jgi:FMN phosphatase YigB (HAD superfamily)